MSFRRGKEDVRYTMTEGIKIFEIALASQKTEKDARGSAFWLRVERNELIPNRRGESLRDFWKENLHDGLDEYMREAVTSETRYCHAFKQIPQVRFQKKEGPYQQAEMRLFGAAQIPVDSLRYKAD